MSANNIESQDIKKLNPQALKDIKFRYKRVGYFGIIWLFLIFLLIGFVCYIEIGLKDYGKIGLTSEMETILPIFYGIISLFLAACWTFCICVAILGIKQNPTLIKSIPGLYALAIAACFIPVLFGFIAYMKINNINKSGKNSERKAFEPYEFKGNYYYFDDKGEYYIAINNEWAKTKNPHKKR